MYLQKSQNLLKQINEVLEKMKLDDYIMTSNVQIKICRVYASGVEVFVAIIFSSSFFFFF